MVTRRLQATKKRESVATAGSTTGVKSLSVGRAPTTYERFLFAVQTGKQAAEGSASMAAMIDEVIEQIRCNPDADVEELARSSHLAECDVERLLLRRLRQPGDDANCAVLRPSAVCGTRQSTPDLLRLSRRETFRDEALATIEKIVGIECLADVVVQATDRPVRASLLRRLLATIEPVLRGYLSPVDQAVLGPNRSTRPSRWAGRCSRQRSPCSMTKMKQCGVAAAMVLGPREWAGGDQIAHCPGDTETVEPAGAPGSSRSLDGALRLAATRWPPNSWPMPCTNPGCSDNSTGPA